MNAKCALQDWKVWVRKRLTHMNNYLTSIKIIQGETVRLKWFEIKFVGRNLYADPQNAVVTSLISIHPSIHHPNPAPQLFKHVSFLPNIYFLTNFLT